MEGASFEKEDAVRGVKVPKPLREKSPEKAPSVKVEPRGWCDGGNGVTRQGKDAVVLFRRKDFWKEWYFVKRRFGLGLVMALCLCVDSGAWAVTVSTPVLPGDFGQGTTGTDVTMGDVQNGYSVVLYSADRTGKQYIGFSGSQYSPAYNNFVFRSPDAASDYDDASDLDFVFIRAGVDAKTHPFSADYDSAVVAGTRSGSRDSTGLRGGVCTPVTSLGPSGPSPMT